MKIVVDANALFSAMLRDGLARKVFFHAELELCAPAFLLEEASKHFGELAKKYSGTSGELAQLLRLLASQVELVPDEKLAPYLPAACKLVLDDQDWLYLACALHSNAALWSNDAQLKKQKRIAVNTTQELAKALGLI